MSCPQLFASTCHLHVQNLQKGVLRYVHGCCLHVQSSGILRPFCDVRIMKTWTRTQTVHVCTLTVHVVEKGSMLGKLCGKARCIKVGIHGVCGEAMFNAVNAQWCCDQCDDLDTSGHHMMWTHGYNCPR